VRANLAFTHAFVGVAIYGELDRPKRLRKNKTTNQKPNLIIAQQFFDFCAPTRESLNPFSY
jgi:hypothetical protein